MKKKLAILSVLTLPFFITATMIERSSSGAPAGHSGAPGEATCAVSGCHDDKAVNAGTAKVDIQFENGLTKYVPGQTYKIKVKITDPNVERFGFQLLALFSQDTSNAGQFQITDAIRTQLIGHYSSPGRKYITYTFRGTDAVNTGVGEWSVNWTAPSTSGSGPVTFYAGAVSANDDMGDKGDYVYTKNLTITN